ncbi:MAG: hypothetical protein P9L92_04555 [Candidatus Electryonea clarkiae]|nr:hypothetical protein [Candidatus Electryonea clarkiae]MDP8287937.1 hypothetical protein [Candidatus Electryonea clarkiae]
MRVIAKIVVVMFMLVTASTVFAGIGIHIGMDMAAVESKDYSFGFDGDLPSYTPSTLGRQESGSPLNIGIDYTIGMIPMIDLVIGFTGAFSNYDISYIPATDTNTGLQAGDPMDETIPYVRAGFELSALYGVWGFPPIVKAVNVMVGAGVGYHLFSPVLSEELLTDKIESADAEIDPLEYADEIEGKIGFHLVGGVKIKPAGVPIGFRVLGKYYIISGQDEGAPENFMNVSAGIYFGF